MKYIPSFSSISSHVSVMSSDLMKRTQLPFSFIQQKTILVAIAIFSCCALFFSFCRHHFYAKYKEANAKPSPLSPLGLYETRVSILP